MNYLELLMMLMCLAIVFISSSQPIMMVVSLIFITLFYSYWVMKVMMSFWFSYALMMVMLSGMFVIFIYMASLVPNEEFEIYGMVFVVLFVFAFLVEKVLLLGDQIFESVSLEMWLSYLGGYIVFLGLILFVVMLMVIWVSCKNSGALRVVY